MPNIPDVLHEPSGIVTEQMVESTEFANSAADLAYILLDKNTELLSSQNLNSNSHNFSASGYMMDPLTEFDTHALKNYANDEATIVEVIKELYLGNCLQGNLQRILRLCLAIVEDYPVCGLNA